MEEFKHYTVMKNEAVDALECQPGKIYVDCTLGGGGHSELILKRIQPDGRLIAFDIDEDAIKASSERLKGYKNLTIVKNSYTNIKQVLKELGIEKITGGVLFDLGASYHQFNKGERGFSFSKEAPLDMRFNQESDFSAYDVVNTYSENKGKIGEADDNNNYNHKENIASKNKDITNNNNKILLKYSKNSFRYDISFIEYNYLIKNFL